MKTFLYSIPNRIQSFSKKLDVKSSLCGKSWEVFNDEGVKQLFIFNEDDSVLISNNGMVTIASWRFIPQNSSILITTNDNSIMFRPAFFDSVIFALKQDGVERYLFLIDEEKKSTFPNLSLETLGAYMGKKNAFLPQESPIEEQEDTERRDNENQNDNEGDREAEGEAGAEAEGEGEAKEDSERAKRQEKERIMAYIQGHKDEIEQSVVNKREIGIIGFVLSIVVTVIASFFNGSYTLPFIIVSLLLTLFFSSMMLTSPIDVIRSNIENGILHHTNAEVNIIYKEQRESK